MVRGPAAARRRILCTSCDLLLEVAHEAKSVNCQHCNQRVITEAMDVDGYVAVRRFAIANRMRIRKKGKVFAAVRSETLEIEGFLQGDAVSLGPVHLAKTAEVRASIRAPSIEIDVGARFSGELRIGPSLMPELANYAAVSQAGAPSTL
jgi:DNA-directed RNA polymerase subunit RPC12/RpoP